MINHYQIAEFLRDIEDINEFIEPNTPHKDEIEKRLNKIESQFNKLEEESKIIFANDFSEIQPCNKQ